ncbi:MAG TPA: multicopper oxidase domain-containing protein [Gemmatimonadales bacterium]|jgi:FtsP/CotA-like multicopper oxidase with cupredoxin domain|nr:multicopper oxidase domain-containing protein [Gemmatimonadales bacterium]
MTLSRRDALKRGLLGAAGVAAAGPLGRVAAAGEAAPPAMAHATDPHAVMTGGVPAGAGLDPLAFLTDFDYGTVTRRADGRTVREFHVVASDRNLEVMPGVFYPAWTYNGQVPGPTLRATEGDLVRVKFVNGGTHPHTIHFHGVHAADMDGVFEVIQPGGAYTYEFDADPFGLHLYHCHTIPIKKHIAKGLYGAFIIDPRTPRPPARELVMVMNGFDVNFDGKNEIYAVNTVPFAYQAHPIPIRTNELVRVYLVNVLEFDLLNSLHLHGNFFHVYRTGTRLVPDEFTDTVSMGQGERHIVEFTYTKPGRFMFHAHQSEFTELGWMGMLDVQDGVEAVD